MPPAPFDVVIIGAGVAGLSAALHLIRLGRRPLVIERFHLGHDRGSSHGQARITRSVYAAADYVRLMQVAHRESWPRLEAESGQRLIHPSPGCFFGPEDGLFSSYATAVEEADADVTRLTPAAARDRFPQFHFFEGEGILDDRTSGVVAAARTMTALAAGVRAGGGVIREGARVRGIDRAGDPLRIETDRGVIETGALIVAAGAWTAGLLPGLSKPLPVTRQSVAYLRLADPAAGRLGAFPVWVELGRAETDVWYGLPSFGADAGGFEGIKVSHHRVVGDDDPDDDVGPSTARLDAMEARLRRRLRVAVNGRSGAERCLYTIAPGEDFVLDHLPDDPRIVVGAGLSGHGFKLGPLIGQILAELITPGAALVPAFAACRARFSLAP